MSVTGQYDICPKCGAVARDGVCQSCGYKIPGVNVVRPQVSMDPASANEADRQYQEERAKWEERNTDVTGTANTDSTNPTYSAEANAQSQQNYQTNGQWQQNAGVNPQSGQWQQSAGNYQQTNQWQQGGANYQQNGQWQQTSGGYQQNGQWQQTPQWGSTAPHKDNTAKVLIIVFAAVFAVIIGVLVLIVFLTKVVENKVNEFSYSFSMPEISGSFLPDVDGSTGDEWTEDDYKALMGDYDGRVADYIISNPDKFIDPNESTIAEEDPYDYDDPDCYQFDDYIVTDAGYRIQWNYWSYSNEEGELDGKGNLYPRNLYIEAIYPSFVDCKLANVAELEETIFDVTAMAGTIYEDEIRDYMDYNDYFYAKSAAYVTYMDSDVISILVGIEGYLYNYDDEDQEKYVVSTIKCYNIDMKTGKILKPEDIVNIDDKLVEDFRELSTVQNDNDISDYTDKEIKKMMLDSDSFIFAYTPLGLEMGINYSNYEGWTTATFVDYEKYLKSY